MFGLGAGFWFFILVVVLVPVALNAYREYNRTSGKGVSLHRDGRRCLTCGYQGRMRTWLGNYGTPQFVTLLGLLFCIIPGLIFIALSWGKYKCPSCGALGKNTQLKGHSNLEPAATPDSMQCPYCAETIKSKAIICRHCQHDLQGKL